jgi:hypothetical protein
MKKPILNENAKLAIERKLLKALQDAELEGGVMSIWGSRFDDFRKEVLKHLSTYVGEQDVDGIVMNVVSIKMREGAVVEQAGMLSEIVAPDQIAAAASQVAEALGRLPNTYDILFPLPRVKIKDTVLLSDGVALVLAPVGASLRMFRSEGEAIAHLKVRAHGYATRSMGQSAMRDAIATLKRTIQIGTLKHVFRKRRRPGNALAMADMLGAPPQPVHEAIVYEVHSSNDRPLFARLGLNMSSYLSIIEIYENSLEDWGLTIPVIRSTSVEDDVRRVLSLPVRLMNEPKATENVTSLRSALEWAFDAAADEDPPARFIKTCIALEAALGEEADEGGITERLADRCAFLLNKTPTDRKRTRSTMRNIYRLRSKLVHGVKTNLTGDDEDLERQGIAHLNAVLWTEINALENWWNSLKTNIRPIDSEPL